MALYDFKCLDCGESFEALVRNSNSPVCPGCQSQNLEQLISMFAVSSETTRQSNLKVARKQNAKGQRDKAIADHEELHHHHD